MPKQVKRTPRRKRNGALNPSQSDTPNLPIYRTFEITDAEFAALVQLGQETAAEYELFLAWINLGRGRTVRKLAAHVLSQELGRQPTTAEIDSKTSTLYHVSGRNEWQDRAAAYVAEQGRHMAAISKEAYATYIETMLNQAAQISGHMQQMIDDFSGRRFKTVSTHQDPNDANRTIQVVHERVNVSDMARLVLAFGRLNKDLRAALGLPSVLEIQGAAGSAIVKGYVQISPDDWDEEPPMLVEGTSERE